MALLPGLGLLGTVLTTRKRNPLTLKKVASTSAIALVLVTALFTEACGSGYKSATNPGTTSVMVTGKSGAMSHSANVTVTVN